MANYDESGRRISTIDNASGFGRHNEIKYSRREDLSPSNWLNRALSGVRSTANNPDATTYDPMDTYGSAMRMVQNQVIKTNQFLNGLRGATNFVRRGYVTLGELFSQHPEADHELVLPSPKLQARRGKYNPMDTEHWSRRDEVGIAAAIVKQVLPAVAAQSMLQTVAFNAVQTGHNTWDIIPYHDTITGMADNMDLRHQWSVFSDNLITMLLIPLTNGGMVDVDLDATVDLVGDTEYTISLDGGDEVPFLYPTFCDSRDSLLMDDNDEGLEDLANNIRFLIEHGTDWNTNGMSSGHLLEDDDDFYDDDDGYGSKEIYTGRESNSRRRKEENNPLSNFKL